MKRFVNSTALAFVTLLLVAGQANAGFYDSTGRHRGVPEFRSDMQACFSTWQAEHQHPAVARPHPVVLHPRPMTTAAATNRQNARLNFVMYTCLPAYGWRPTSS